MRNDYLTVKKSAEARLVIRKSLFISYVERVDSEEAALAFIESIRRKHWDATHNCYAYIIGDQGDIKRFSDDGEPSGTAGKPILNVLERLDLTNTVIVVTRYFGGIMLGAGGLIRAYGESAKVGIEASGLVERVLSSVVRLSVDYSQFGRLERELHSRGYELREKNFGTQVDVLLLVPVEDIGEFTISVTNLTNGEGLLEIIGEDYLEVEAL